MVKRKVDLKYVCRIVIAIFCSVAFIFSASLFTLKQTDQHHEEAPNVTNVIIISEGDEPKGAAPVADNLIRISEPWETDYRIPRWIEPKKYHIHLHPHLLNETFTGRVEIEIHCTKEFKYLVIHNHGLRVTMTRLKNSSNFTEPIERAFLYPDNFFWVIIMQNHVKHGRYSLELEFNGDFGQINGFYRSSYEDPATGTVRYLATTQFEPTFARKAFPCFDEPALKARFKVSLVKPRNGNYIALSNTYITNESPGPGPEHITVSFAWTVKMSTYLLCFIVSDFETSGPRLVENQGNPFPVRIYSKPRQVKNTAFAKRAAAEIMEYFVNYFDIPYVLPKLDVVAIPDFAAGAMENWGLITFKEHALLHNPEKNDVASKQLVSLIVSHELSHQWFGNLVTMKWWDDLWLNEGFARFMEKKGVDEGFSEAHGWHMREQAIKNDLQTVMGIDEMLSSHPIVQPVSHPDEINELFDFISYGKGSAIIGMLESFLGEEGFRRGIRNYLRKHQFSTATTDDLWMSMNSYMRTEIVHVKQVMDTWTRQMGYPVVTVFSQDGNWLLFQKRFLAEPDAFYNASESEYGYKWNIPIAYINSENERGVAWLLRENSVTTLPAPQGTQWMKLNYRRSGFFRVDYDVPTWLQWIDLMQKNHKALSRIDRANLLDDAFALAGAKGNINHFMVIDLASYLPQEVEFLPMSTTFNRLTELRLKLTGSIHAVKITDYSRLLLNSFYGDGESQYNWNIDPDDSHLRRLSRIEVLNIACTVNVRHCIPDVTEKFQSWLRGNISLHPDIRGLVYSFGMKNAFSDEDWNMMWDRYVAETNAQERNLLLKGLAMTPVPEILRRFLDYLFEGLVRPQDYLALMEYAAANPVGMNIAWDYYRDHYEELVDRYTVSDRHFAGLITKITKSFSTQSQLHEMIAFFKKYPEGGAGAKGRLRAVENIQNNILWLERNEKQLGDSLDQFLQKPFSKRKANLAYGRHIG